MYPNFINLSMVALMVTISCHVTVGQHGKQTTCWIPQGGYSSCRGPSSSMLQSQDPQMSIKYLVTINDLTVWTLVCCRALACDHLYSDMCGDLRYISMGCGRTSFSKTLQWGANSDVPEVQCQSRSRDVNVKVEFIPLERSENRHQGHH